jgi:hypothetical protein
MTAIQYAWGPILAAYTALGEVAYVTKPDSVLAVMMRAKEDLGRFPTADKWPVGTTYTSSLLMHFKTATVEAVRDALLPFKTASYAERPFPPVSASYWFPKAPDTWPPGRGRASLVFYGGWLLNRCARDQSLFANLASDNLGCRTLYTYLPLWAKQYGDRLVITAVSQTAGRALMSNALEPAAEADTLRWFFQDHLHLPVLFGVVTDTVRTFPDPDGRQFRRDTSFYANREQRTRWNWESPLTVLLYGPQGELVFASNEAALSRELPLLRALLERTVRQVSPVQATEEHP